MSLRHKFDEDMNSHCKLLIAEATFGFCLLGFANRLVYLPACCHIMTSFGIFHLRISVCIAVFCLNHPTFISIEKLGTLQSPIICFIIDYYVSKTPQPHFPNHQKLFRCYI